MKEEVNEKKLKPVTFIKGEYNYSRQNDLQQKLLLKAMQVTSDPNELKKMAGLKTVTDVYRTLDKLAIRREYHEALVRSGVDLDTIIGGIKEIATTSTKDATRLKAYQIFLKSLGLDEYKESPDEAKQSWEDLLKDVVEKEDTKLIEAKEEYSVIIPEVPEHERKKREEEDEIGKSIYE